MKSTGDIAGLPRQVRFEPNTRLDNGMEAHALIGCLNALPDIHSRIKSRFEIRPVAHQLLSDWKTGAVLNRQRSQHSCHPVRNLIDLAGLLVEAEQSASPDPPGRALSDRIRVSPTESNKTGGPFTRERRMLS